MEIFNIAIIKPNNFLFDKTQESLSQIKQYIELKEVTQDTLMETIIDILNISSNIVSETSMSYEDSEYVYQISHIKRNAKYNKSIDTNQEVNGIASYLVKGREEIYGIAILLCFKIMDNNKCSGYTIKLDDINRLLYKKIVHVGLKVNCDGAVEECTFTEDIVDKHSNYDKRIELSVLNFNLIVIVCSKPKPNKINKKATILFGDKKIHGIVYVALLETSNIFSSITKEVFSKLLTVLSTSMYCRNLKSNELKDKQCIDGESPIIMNNHCILEKRYIAHKHLCEGCGKEFDKNKSDIKCPHCFRMKYCSIKCKKDDWYTHSHDCLHNTQIYNKIV